MSIIKGYDRIGTTVIGCFQHHLVLWVREHQASRPSIAPSWRPPLIKHRCNIFCGGTGRGELIRPRKN
jgi:hypothetical protein